MSDEPIEVGASADGVRYWMAVEACRQGEVRLTAQAASLTAIETRCTSILSWSVAGALALVAGATQGRWQALAIGAGLSLAAAAVASIAGLWPRRWHPPGYAQPDLKAMQARTELAVRERIALGYATGIEQNAARLALAGRLLRVAWIAFAASPVAGLIGAVLIR